MALPNYVEALRRARGNRPARMAAFLRQRARPREINITTAYLRPEHQNRGLILVLTAACQQAALKLGARCGLLGPVPEQNRPMLAVMEKSGVVFDIRHRIFEREIK
jgi:GNAT superfamily N-acetyltransferase